MFLLVKKPALQGQIDGFFREMIIFTTEKPPLNVMNFVTTNVTTRNASLHWWKDWFALL